MHARRSSARADRARGAQVEHVCTAITFSATPVCHARVQRHASCAVSAVSVRVTTHLRVGKVWRNLVDHAHQSGGGVHRDFRLGILLFLVCHARMHSSRRRRHHVLCAAPGQCEQGPGARGRETFGGHPVQLYQVFSLITSESYQLYDFGTKSIRIRFEFTPYVYRMPHSEKCRKAARPQV